MISQKNILYDAAIIGGGLAGLTSALLLSKAGFKVVLIEKNAYPFHRVCGEYISNETLPFLQSQGLDPFQWGAVPIHRFRLTSPKGTILEMPLGLGGFGISRYTLDKALCDEARQNGVVVLEKFKVLGVEQQAEIKYIKIEKEEDVQAKLVIGAFGKRANLDAVLKREFFIQKSPYIGVKYHLRLPLPLREKYEDDRITLHNFKNGYCGISRVENDAFCLCYLTTRTQLKTHRHIEALEKNVLCQNPHLRELFESSEPLYEKPLVINEISFADKSLIEKGLLMCGDAAGMITPLCGNGMSMAIHGAKVLSKLVIRHLEGEIKLSELEDNYRREWKSLFASRLRFGRLIQRWFGHPLMTELLLQSAKKIPPLARFLVNQSHGVPF